MSCNAINRVMKVQASLGRFLTPDVAFDFSERAGAEEAIVPTELAGRFCPLEGRLRPVAVLVAVGTADARVIRLFGTAPWRAGATVIVGAMMDVGAAIPRSGSGVSASSRTGNSYSTYAGPSASPAGSLKAGSASLGGGRDLESW